MWKIKSITQDGQPRTDGRYPLRVGCTGDFFMLEVGFPMLFKYKSDADGNKKDGSLRSSTVTRIVSGHRRNEVDTLNSVYTFEKL